MDNVTQQNAALVEEAAAAAQAMQDQVDSLNQVVATFRMARDVTQAARARGAPARHAAGAAPRLALAASQASRSAAARKADTVDSH